MRQLSALLSSILLMSFAHAQIRPQPIRLCISAIQNSSRTVVDTTWQRNQLIRAFERNNKSKDVTKGKAARVETVLGIKFRDRSRRARGELPVHPAHERG